MPQDFTTTQDNSCTCEVCQFIELMARHLPALPQDFEGMGNALGVVLLNAEVRKAFRPVLRRFDRMGRLSRKDVARVFAEMNATERSLAIVLMDDGTRDALKSMVRAADRGDV